MSPAELILTDDYNTQNISSSMPSQQELARELLFLNNGLETTRQRVHESVDFLQAVSRARELASSETQINDIVLQELFSAGVDFYGHTALFVSEGRDEPDWHNEKSQQFLVQAVTARKDLLEWIGVYSQRFKDEEEESLYKVLRNIMEDAKRVVAGSETLDPRHASIVHDHLRGILAEYKVLSAVQSAWPEAVYSDPEDDLDGRKVDILVPDGYGQTLGLQVKGRANQIRVGVSWRETEQYLLVLVPMSESGSQFKLSEGDTRRLIRRVNRQFGYEDQEDIERAAA